MGTEQESGPFTDEGPNSLCGAGLSYGPPVISIGNGSGYRLRTHGTSRIGMCEVETMPSAGLRDSP